MPFRQIAVVLVALIVIVGAALLVLSWGDDGDGEGDGANPSSTTTSSSTTTTTTTLGPAPSTSIPVACESEEPPETTTTVAAEETTTTAAADPPGGENEEEPLFPTLGPNSSVSTVGLDEVSFGLTVAQAETAAGTLMIPCEPVSDCYRVSPAVGPEGISFVVYEGTIERVDIVDGPITTSSGAGIGTSGERLVELFGEQIERRVLGTNAVDFIFVPSDENDAEFRVVWTVVDGLVETFRSGRIPLVLEADPCGA